MLTLLQLYARIRLLPINDTVEFSLSWRGMRSTECPLVKYIELHCDRSVGGECYGGGLAGQEPLYTGRGTEADHCLFTAEKLVHRHREKYHTRQLTISCGRSSRRVSVCASGFYIAPQCSHCKRCISYSNSVCPSVCPSHAGIVSKRRHVAWCCFHCRIAKCV